MTTMPDLASANTVQLRYFPEATFGTTPGAGNCMNLRMTGESLNFDRTKESDKEINATGELTSSTTVDAGVAGDIKVHMQYAEYDRFLAAVLRNTWSAFGTNGVGATFSGTFTTTTITAGSATSGSSIFTNLKKGQWFRLLAPTDSNNGKLLRVSTTTAPTTTVITLDASTALTAAGPIANCAIQTARLTTGTDLTSFSIERDTGVGEFFNFRGCVPSKFSTSLAASSQIEATFSLLGKDQARGTSTMLPGTPVASNTYDIQNAVDGVGQIWEGTAPLTSTYVKSVSIDLDSGLRAQKAVGNLGLVGIGIGTFVAKGTLEVYFADGTMFDKFDDDTYTSLTFSMQDSSGNGYVITMPRVQLNSAKVMAGSKDTDLMASFEYTAYQDSANADTTLRKSVFIDRVGVAVSLA